MKHYCKNDKPYVYVAFQQEQKEEILPVLESVAVDGAQFWYADRLTAAKRAVAAGLRRAALRYD